MSETRAPYRAEPDTMTVEQFHIARAARVPEYELLEEVRKKAKRYGWYFHHHRWSKGSSAGLPDTFLLRPPRLVLAELKRQRTHPTLDQEIVLALLEEVKTTEAYLWRPSDLLDGTIEEVLR